MVTYRQRVREIERRLAGRRLVYFGTRGTDARSLLEISNFEEVFSQIAPLEAVGIQETCLETLKKERVDLDSYSIDQDSSEAVHEIRKGLLRAFSRPAAVIPYRPSAVLASACFTRANLVKYMGLFHEFQACFEHKPWIETQLAEAGVRVVPWRYFADDDMALIREAAEAGPIVLRTNRSDGGAGLTLAEKPSQLQREWPIHNEGFLAAAPFLTPAIPLNVNACVFSGGEVSLHAPSLQIIGIPACTNRRFGYCGNDFAAVGELDRKLLYDLEQIVLTTGRWLGKKGYLGAFGVDAIVHSGTVYLVEVNPRFQGSSAHAAALDRELDLPDLYLDHMAAFLDLPAPEGISLADQARLQPKLAHVVAHNLSGHSLAIARPDSDRFPVRCTLLPHPEVAISDRGILFAAIFQSSVTETGMELLPYIADQIEFLLRTILTRQQLASILTDPQSC
ncbi:MAG TPA: ATP-grasp domain-containing protein [Thermoanaerobaculia bacterium]|nr:ATP-grasp domain-containing protein [Thermoanaerobaculia bacterium]